MTNRTSLLLIAFGLFATNARADDADKFAFFEKKIRPVLVDSCQKCHGPEKANGKLRLDTKASVLKGGITGPVLVPGKAKDSLLIKAIRHADPDLKMPPPDKGAKLSDAVIADFEKWINDGAADPRDGKQPAVADGIDWKKAREFWSFVPPKMPALPKVQNEKWAKGPIDRFILAKIEAEKLTPVRPASKRELIRRATFDLTGLPPTPEEVEAFVNDQSPDAFAKVVDRLLASPHYGERWGRYWLDVARYAEDQAHTFEVIPNTNAWRYRDWVINAFNDDMPYDRFVKLQIAADMIEQGDGLVKNVPALGFFGLGAQYYKNTDAAKAIADELDDRVDTLTRGFLGLTVSCARCHDHKFDPVPQIDYYSLAGVFTSCKIANVPLADKEKVKRNQETQAQIKKLDGEVKQTMTAEKKKHAQTKADELPKYLIAAWKVQSIKQKNPKASVAEVAKNEMLDEAALNRCVKFVQKQAGFEMMRKMTASEKEVVAAATTMHKQIKSMINSKGKLDKMKTDLLNNVFYADSSIFRLTDTEIRNLLPEVQRKQLEEKTQTLSKLQASDDAKPLPIAHGLAETTATNMKVYLRGNPAKQGEVAPRRFLKILAEEPKPFTQGSGRLELANAIASKDNPLTARVMVNRIWQYHFGKPIVASPSNFGSLGEKPSHPELLDYLAVRFMEQGWSIKKMHREMMLSSTYQLSAESNDKNFNIDGDNRWFWRMKRRRLDIESWRDSMLAVSGKLDRKLGGPTTNLAAGDNVRRTVYAKISRHDLNATLRLFDFPDANITSERRVETTVPQQQLFVLNSPFVIETSKAFAARIQKDASNDADRIQRAFALAYGRPASADEMQLFEAYLQSKDAAGENRLNRWERVAQILIGSNEFMYVD
ncbi:MAG TPA: PSD1 and planctomycete cytochrome C domain-containing protein [Gemmataceae bacterium]|nr:PSD1 and planctomycete cytochrome C domain-containing protein [Gemmataceae bacterium]